MHAIIFVLLAGLSINSYNAGGVNSLSDVKAAAVKAYETRQPYDSGTLKNSHTGNFGND